MKDIQVDERGFLKVENGDFVIGPGEQQHIAHLLETHKGCLRGFPVLGFGINRFVKGTNNSLTRFKRELKIELENDVFPNAEINADDLLNLKIEV